MRKTYFVNGLPFCFILWFIILSNSLQGQSWPSEMWHEGKVILESGDTLKGKIKYDLPKELIQITVTDQTVEAYSARNVLYFQIFDNTVRKYRNFYSLPYATTTNYKAPVFFELLEEGKITLLGREALEYRTYYSPYSIGSYTRLVMVNHYFLMNEKGEITEFIPKKNDLLKMMGNKADDVEKYMKQNRLKLDDKYDFARIVDYYNSLFE